MEFSVWSFHSWINLWIISYNIFWSEMSGLGKFVHFLKQMFVFPFLPFVVLFSSCLTNCFPCTWFSRQSQIPVNRYARNFKLSQNSYFWWYLFTKGEFLGWDSLLFWPCKTRTKTMLLRFKIILPNGTQELSRPSCGQIHLLGIVEDAILRDRSHDFDRHWRRCLVRHTCRPLDLLLHAGKL